MTSVIPVALLVSGLLVAVAALGMVASGARGPLNLTALFSAMWLVAVLAGCNKPSNPIAAEDTEFGNRSFEFWIPIIFSLAASFLLIRAVAQPFLSDDFNLVYGDPYSVSMWWTAGGEGFYRPVGQWLMDVARQILPPTELAWGAWGLIANVGCSVLAGVFARQLLLRIPECSSFSASHGAVWSAALFLAHGAHPEAAIWVAGRFDVLATAFLLAGLLAALRWLDLGSAVWMALSLMLMVLSIATKEIAYGYPLLFVLMGWVCRAGRTTLRNGFLIHAAAAGAMLAFRFWMFEGVGGYAAQNGGAEILSVTPLHVAKAVFTRVYAVLLIPVNWSLPLGGVAAVVFGLAVLALAYIAWRGRTNARLWCFGVLWVLVAAAPGVAQLLLGPDLSKSRLLYLPSVGFCILLGAAAASVRGRCGRLAQAGLVLGMLAVLHHNLAIWSDTGEIVLRTCRQAAAIARNDSRPLRIEGLPGTINGVYAFVNGFPLCVAQHSDRDPESIDNASDNFADPPVPGAAVWQWDDEKQQLHAASPARPW